ncbi:MAG: hypothetical protein KAS96_11030 [Planctomycetes bacterium]|nr:hypothetical protein [Planctomycetota bacterium]
MSNLVQDGSFSLSIGSTPWENLAQYPDQSRWTLLSGKGCYNPDYVNNDTDVLWQSISIVSGKSYRVSFDISGAWQYDGGPNVGDYSGGFDVKLGGVLVGQVFADGNYNYDVVAGADGKISIEGFRMYEDSSSLNLFIDNIEVLGLGTNLKGSLTGSILIGKGLV